MKIVQIITVDDHPIFRKGLAFVLNQESNMKVVAEAGNGIEFLNFLDNEQVSLAFVDIKMPLIDGIEASKRALEKQPELKIIMLSAFGEEALYKQAIDAGVHGFLLKTVDEKQLKRAIQTVLSGETFFQKELIREYSKQQINAEENTSGIKLSAREHEIILMMSKGYSANEIAKSLFISQRTVEGHRSNLINKTGSRNSIGLVMYALQHKLIKLPKPKNTHKPTK